MIDTDGAPVCAQKNLVVAGSTNDTEVDEVLLNCANEFSFLVKNENFPVFSKDKKVSREVRVNYLLYRLLNLDLLEQLSTSLGILPDLNAVALQC